MTNTIIIDIETLDTTKTAAVLSIGAIAFNRFNYESLTETLNNSEKLGSHAFYSTLDIAEQILNGRTVGKETQEFWQKNKLKSWYKVPEDKNGFILSELSEFLSAHHEDNPKIQFYARGVGFDFSILENLFAQYNVDFPIKYYQQRDVRSYIDALSGGENGYLAGFKPTFDYKKHHALDDAKRDAEMMYAAYCMAK